MSPATVHAPGAGATRCLLTATDLFAGAGGSSEGLRRGGHRVVVAANHDPVAVATHELNHPGTEHHTADLAEVDWHTFPRAHLLWGSPSYVWHARSGAGGRPPAKVDSQRCHRYWHLRVSRSVVLNRCCRETIGSSSRTLLMPDDLAREELAPAWLAPVEATSLGFESRSGSRMSEVLVSIWS